MDWCLIFSEQDAAVAETLRERRKEQDKREKAAEREMGRH